MTAPVVVQGLPPAADHRSAALGACSAALERRTCVAVEETEAGAPAPSVFATVIWPDGDLRHVRISLERRDRTLPGELRRDTHFANEDPFVERWRAVGVVIAALVGESEERPVDRERHVPSFGAGAPPVFWLGLSALVGPGLDEGSFRAGVTASASKRFERLPVFLSVSGSYAFRPVDGDGIHVRWATVGAGGGFLTSLPHVDVGLRMEVEIILEYLRAAIDAPAVTSAGGERLSPGLRGKVEAVWPAGGPLSVTAGLTAWMLSGGTAIHLDERKLGSSAWLSYAGLLGGQWSFR